MNRFAGVRLSALLVAASIVSGCVSAPPRQSYNRAAQAVKTIVVLPMRQSTADVVIMNNPGYSFGLIGALVAEANLAPKRDKLRTQLRQAGFDQGAALRESLGRALQQRGYAVVWPEQLIDPNSHTPRDGFGGRKAFGSVGDGQAQLDMDFNFIGYTAAGATKNAPYRPTVRVSARLIDSTGKSTLFRDTFAYNNVAIGPARDAVSIEADPQYSYPDFDDLDAADAKSAEGLRVAIQAIADKIAERL